MFSDDITRVKCNLRVKCIAFTLIDHILTGINKKVVQAGIIKTSYFCTRKVKREKSNKPSYRTFYSMKNFATDINEEAMSKLTFPDYENFSCVNIAHIELTSKFL